MGTQETAGGPLTDIREIAAGALRMRGEWLLAVVCGGPPGEFIVRELPGTEPMVFGGDVLIRARPDWTPASRPRIEVWAVVRNSVVPVAVWNSLPARTWPEAIRPTVAFAMTALNQLGEVTVLGELDPAPLRRPDLTGPVGLPPLIWPGRLGQGR